MDRGTWQTTVHGVAKSRTRLSDFLYLYIYGLYIYGLSNYVYLYIYYLSSICFIHLFIGVGGTLGMGPSFKYRILLLWVCLHGFSQLHG